MELQTSLAISLGGWLLGHPYMSRIMGIVAWIANHPLWSVGIGLLSIALILNIIKVISQGIEAISMAILKTPLQLAWEAIKFVFKWLQKGLILSWATFRNEPENIVLEDKVADAAESQQIQIQARLSEITHRLSQIQQEQAELLQEAAVLIESKSKDSSLLHHVNGKTDSQLLKPSKASINS